MPTNIVAGEDGAGIFSAVQHTRFRPLWTASILSCVAYMTALTACGWVAFDLHHHSSTVGLVVFASFLPSLIVTPFAGVFADRYDRRTMLLAMNAIGALSTLGLAWFAWAGCQSACRSSRSPSSWAPPVPSSTPMEQASLGSARPCARSAQRRLPSPGESERRTAAGATAGRAVAPFQPWRRCLPGRGRCSSPWPSGRSRC